jgi:hypothetical protein
MTVYTTSNYIDNATDTTIGISGTSGISGNYVSAGNVSAWNLDKYLYRPMNRQTLNAINSDIINYNNSIYHQTGSATNSIYSTEVSNSTIKYTTAYTMPASSTYRVWEPMISTDIVWSVDQVCAYGEGVSETQWKKKNKLKQNLVILVKSRAENIALKSAPQNELVAIETLREMISEEAFRKYMIHGFILVQGSDGCTYQIFRNRHHTKVWRGGKIIEEICVRIKAETKAPATDNVIAFKTMIEANAENFKKLGNIYKMQVSCQAVA